MVKQGGRRWKARIPGKVRLVKMEPGEVEGKPGFNLECPANAISEQPTPASVAMFRCPKCNFVVYAEQRFMETLTALQTVEGVEAATPRHIECNELMVLVTPTRGRNEMEETVDGNI